MEYIVNALDKFDVTLLQQLKSPTFMPLLVKTYQNQCVIKYELDEYVPISSLNVLDESIIMRLLNQLVNVIDEINCYLLSENKLCVALEAIFINETHVKWCYYPEIKKPDKLDIAPFLKSLLLHEKIKLETATLLPLYQRLHRPIFCNELNDFLKQQDDSTNDITVSYENYIHHNCIYQSIEKNSIETSKFNNSDAVQHHNTYSANKVMMYNHTNNLVNYNKSGDAYGSNKNKSLSYGNVSQNNFNDSKTYTQREHHNVDDNILSNGSNVVRDNIWVKSSFVDKVLGLFKRQTNHKSIDNIVDETTVLSIPIKHRATAFVKDVMTNQEVTILDTQDLIIGSFEHNPFGCLQSQGISKQHAKIMKTSQGYVLTDLNSTNGTKVNGKVILHRDFIVLSHGDIVDLGNKQFQFLVK